jgi:hypothetical protein
LKLLQKRLKTLPKRVQKITIQKHHPLNDRKDESSQKGTDEEENLVFIFTQEIYR